MTTVAIVVETGLAVVVLGGLLVVLRYAPSFVLELLEPLMSPAMIRWINKKTERRSF